MRKLYVLLIFFFYMLLGCSKEQEIPSITQSVHHDWSKIIDPYTLRAYLYDSTESYGSEYYVGDISLKQIEAYLRMEQYIDSTTDRDCAIIRVKNELNLMGLNPSVDSLQATNFDEWNHGVPYILGEICFVIQSHPDSLRFVFLTDWSNTSTIVDTTVKYSGTFIESVLTCSVDSTSKRYLGFQSRPEHRPFDVTMSILTKEKSFTIYSWQLWYYSDCGKPETWFAADGVDVELMKNLLHTVCQIYTIGGFRSHYGLKPSSTHYQ